MRLLEGGQVFNGEAGPWGVGRPLPLPFPPALGVWALGVLAIAAYVAACLLGARIGGVPLGAPLGGAVALIGMVALILPPVAWAGATGPLEGTVVYRGVLSDPLGSGSVLLDGSGDRVRHTVFRPFGAVYEEVGPGFGTSRLDRRYFAGHASQEETGLVYMQARWLDPEVGRFLSVDPLIRSLEKPQSLNGYSYVENNPTLFVDPTGMASFNIQMNWDINTKVANTKSGAKVSTSVSSSGISVSGGGESESGGSGGSGGDSGGGGESAVGAVVGDGSSTTAASTSQSGNLGDSEGGGRAVDYNNPVGADRIHELPIADRTAGSQHEVVTKFGEWVDGQPYGARARGEFVSKVSPLPDNGGWVFDNPRWFRGSRLSFGNSLTVGRGGFLVHSHPISSPIGIYSLTPSGLDLRTSVGRVDFVVQGRSYIAYTRGFNGQNYISRPVGF